MTVVFQDGVKRALDSKGIVEDFHGKKRRVLASFDKCLALFQLVDQNMRAPSQLQIFQEFIMIHFGAGCSTSISAFENLISSFSQDQLEELQGLMEWVFILDFGITPFEFFQKENPINYNLKKYLNINRCRDILIPQNSESNAVNPISIAELATRLENAPSIDAIRNSSNQFAVATGKLISICKELISVDRVLKKVVVDFEIEESDVKNLRNEIEKLPLEIRLRVVLLVSSIRNTLALMPSYESLISKEDRVLTPVADELNSLIQLFEHHLIQLRWKNAYGLFLNLVQFHIKNNYNKIVADFKSLFNIDFAGSNANVLSLAKILKEEEVRELHSIIEWRYLLLQGRTASDSCSFESVKRYLGIGNCAHIVTQNTHPGPEYNRISINSLCTMLEERALSKKSQKRGDLFFEMKNYCLDRIEALLSPSDLQRTFVKDLELDEMLVRQNLVPDLAKRTIEEKLRILLLVKVLRFCDFTDLENELGHEDLKLYGASRKDFELITLAIEICYSNKTVGCYTDTQKVLSWDYSPSHTLAMYREISHRMKSVHLNMPELHYSKLNFPGMPNWMPNVENSCYISSSLWALYFLLDSELQEKIRSAEVSQKLDPFADQEFLKAKSFLINLYKEISSPEEKKISKSAINNLRKAVHASYPASFLAPGGTEQEDAYDFLHCILELFGVKSPLPEVQEFLLRHSYSSFSAVSLVDQEHYDWSTTLNTHYSQDKLHMTLDISLGQSEDIVRKLSELVTEEHRTEDVEKNAYKKDESYNGPHHQTVKVQHSERVVVSSLTSAPKYFVGRLTRFKADFTTMNCKKRKDVVVPDAILAFCVSGRESESIRVLYDLVAITCHRGNSIHRGHYYTYGCKFELGQAKFYKYDDNEAPKVCDSIESVIQDIATNGYIIYYKKRDDKEIPQQVNFEKDFLPNKRSKVFEVDSWLQSQNLSTISCKDAVFISLKDLFSAQFPDSKECLLMLEEEPGDLSLIEACSLILGRRLYLVDPVRDSELKVVDGEIVPGKKYCQGDDFVNKPALYIFSLKGGGYVFLNKALG